ncbi:Uncharacterised protein [Streptococcus pneumoniae]|nr:Uncharacterised protein [Streptococcus pneumoniae]
MVGHAFLVFSNLDHFFLFDLLHLIGHICFKSFFIKIVGVMTKERTNLAILKSENLGRYLIQEIAVVTDC